MQSTRELNRARSLALAVSLYTIMILRQERIDTEAPFMASSAKAGCMIMIFHATPMIKSTGRLTIFQTLVGTIKQHSPHSGQYLSNVTINEHQINKT
jgi:hypothetical protein